MAQNTSSGSIDVELPVDIFDVQVNIPLIHQVVVAQLAAARQGTHSTLRRGEVAGGGRKPYRQKGTGRARQGSIRAPQFNGGGTVHGPTPRSYDQRTPKKMKAAALRGALSDRVRSGRVHVVDFLVEGDKPSTKNAVNALFQLTQRPRVLVVIDREDTVTPLSLRNIHDLVLLPFDQLNTYDVLLSDDIVFTKAAYDGFVAARSAEGVETIKLSKAAVEVAEKGAAKPAAKNAAKKAPVKKAAAKTAEPKAEKKAAAPAKLADAPAADTIEEAPAATKTQPYGPGSKAPLKSGNAPKGFDIKGNADSMKYHTTESQWYEQTVAEVWFDTVESAEAAGFTAPGAAPEEGAK
jgi:large subunit ribosomal protein L4